MTRPSRRLRRQTPVVPPAPRVGFDPVPVLIALIAAAIRLPHLGWGLPAIEEEAIPMRRALEMWGWDVGRIHWNPDTAGWPALSFYIHLALQHLHFGVGHLLGWFESRNDYLIAFWLDPTPLVVLSRLVSVVACAAVAGIGAHIALRLAGRHSAIVVGLLLAVSPLLVEHGQLITPDVLGALFAAFAVMAIVDIFELGRVRDYLIAGTWIGLGAATKYTPVLLLPGVLVAHALGVQRDRGRLAPRDLLDRRLVLSMVAVLVSYSAANPFFWIDPAVVRRDLSWQFTHMAEGHFGQGARRARFVTYCVEVLGPALGFPALIASVLGLGFAAVRRRGVWLVLAACVAPYYLIVAGFSTYFARYMLPIIMPLTLGLAAWRPSLDSLPAWFQRSRRAFLVVIAVVLLAPPAFGTWRHLVEIGRPSARQLATAFFEADSGGTNPYIATEVLGVNLRRDRWLASVSSEFLGVLNEAQRRQLASIRTFHVDFLPMYTTNPGASAIYYDLRHWLPYDYIVTAEAVRSRYFADSTAYPNQVSFYHDLDRFGTVVRTYGRGGGASGPEVRVYRIDLTAKGALLAERGEIAAGFHAPFAAPLDSDDFLEFTEGVGRAALDHGDVRTAERYYSTMLAASQHSMPDAARSKLAAFVARLREENAAKTPP